MKNNSQVKFLASLNLPNLRRITNDPIAHDENWPTMATKLPSSIPKFKGNREKTQEITS